MLVHHEIEFRLFPIPADRFHNGTAHAAAPDNADAVDSLFGRTIGIGIRIPKNLVTAFGQIAEVGLRHPFRSPGQGVFRIAPIEHHESHRQRLNNPLFHKRIFREREAKAAAFLKLCFSLPPPEASELSAGKLLLFACWFESTKRC